MGQAGMENTNINLMLSVYTDTRRLDQVGAVERLSAIPLEGDDQSEADALPAVALIRETKTASGAKFVPLPVPLKSDNECQSVANLARLRRRDARNEKSPQNAI
ncbi:hypothetical protein SAMN06265222_12289 [Neorhodopirellula lusitana]|uniref:Uncharacterized protein n=2 Tax=Neorhodopirellula lusitana TaxID=445327 RepID=A0ABY1QPE4_9BACT|nr:hypothetical protein SAMN06265222_12289 [Neorhodopirellula lusitana]